MIVQSLSLWVYIKNIENSPGHSSWIHYCFGIIIEGLIHFLEQP